jgi:hypothetical protein
MLLNNPKRHILLPGKRSNSQTQAHEDNYVTRQHRTYTSSKGKEAKKYSGGEAGLCWEN